MKYSASWTLITLNRPTSRWGVLAASLLIAWPAFAHGEEVLVFPLSFLVLLIPALVIVAAAWHRLWVRLFVALALLASNVLLWFSPVFPQTVGAFAAYDLRKAIVILLLGPALLAGGLAAFLLKAVKRAPVDHEE